MKRWPFGLLPVVIGWVSTLPVTAQTEAEFPCFSSLVAAPPTAETQTYQHPSQGWAFELPANFVTVIEEDAVQVMSPVVADIYACVLANPYPTSYLPDSVVVEVSPVAASPMGQGEPTLMTAVEQHFDLENLADITGATVVGGEAALELDQDALDLQAFTVFLSPDQQLFFRISTPYHFGENEAGQPVVDELPLASVYDLVRETFRFE